MDQQGRSFLFVAAREGGRSLASTLMNRGAAVNQATTDIGATPLIVAAQNGHLPVVELLLDRGADVNQETIDGLKVDTLVQQGLGETGVSESATELGLR
jgi:ankyrin repeat protein